MSQPNVKRAVLFLDNFFTNDHDQPNEPAKCKEDVQVSDNSFVMIWINQMGQQDAKKMVKFLTTFS